MERFELPELVSACRRESSRGAGCFSLALLYMNEANKHQGRAGVISVLIGIAVELTGSIQLSPKLPIGHCFIYNYHED